jgi:hypothetical protein
MVRVASERNTESDLRIIEACAPSSAVAIKVFDRAEGIRPAKAALRYREAHLR